MHAFNVNCMTEGLICHGEFSEIIVGITKITTKSNKNAVNREIEKSRHM